MGILGPPRWERACKEVAKETELVGGGHGGDQKARGGGGSLAEQTPVGRPLAGAGEEVANKGRCRAGVEA